MTCIFTIAQTARHSFLHHGFPSSSQFQLSLALAQLYASVAAEAGDSISVAKLSLTFSRCVERCEQQSEREFVKLICKLEVVVD